MYRQVADSRSQQPKLPRSSRHGTCNLLACRGRGQLNGRYPAHRTPCEPRRMGGGNCTSVTPKRTHLMRPRFMYIFKIKLSPCGECIRCARFGVTLARLPSPARRSSRGVRAHRVPAAVDPFRDMPINYTYRGVNFLGASVVGFGNPRLDGTLAPHGAKTGLSSGLAVAARRTEKFARAVGDLQVTLCVHSVKLLSRIWSKCWRDRSVRPSGSPSFTAV